MACKTGKPEVVQLLLNQGAEVSVGAQNDLGLTPLHMASQEGHLEVAQQLLSRGADVNTLEADGETPLHLAAYYGHLKVTELLLKHSANIHGRNEDGETPFDLASKEGHHEIEHLLSTSVSVDSEEKCRGVSGSAIPLGGGVGPTDDPLAPSHSCGSDIEPLNVDDAC